MNAEVRVTLLGSELEDIIKALRAQADQYSDLAADNQDEKAKRMAKHLYALAGRLDDVKRTATGGVNNA